MTRTYGPEPEGLRENHERRCTATVKNGDRKGERCLRWAIAGGNVCPKHGGSAPQVKRKGAERRVLAKLQSGKLALTDDVVTMDLVDPRDALTRELIRTAMAIDTLGGLVNDLALDENGIPTGTPRGKLYGELLHHTGTPTGEAKPHVLWTMWMAERQHFVRVAKEASNAGVEARRIALAEQTALMIAKMMRDTAADPELGLSEAAQKLFLQVVAKHMRALPR